MCVEQKEVEIYSLRKSLQFIWYDIDFEYFTKTLLKTNHINKRKLLKVIVIIHSHFWCCNLSNSSKKVGT